MDTPYADMASGSLRDWGLLVLCIAFVLLVASCTAPAALLAGAAIALLT